MKPVGNGRNIVVRQSGYALLVFAQKLADLLLLYSRVIVVVRLKGLYYAVLLSLNGLVGLVDRKVELGYQRTVHPRLAYVVSELRSAVARKEAHDDDHGCNHQRHSCQDVSEIMFVSFVEFAHFYSY